MQGGTGRPGSKGGRKSTGGGKKRGWRPRWRETGEIGNIYAGSIPYPPLPSPPMHAGVVMCTLSDLHDKEHCRRANLMKEHSFCR